MKEITERLASFLEERPTMAQNNTFDNLIQYAEEETDELFEAIKNGFSDDEVAREVADGLIFLISAMMALGRDPKEEILSKIERNENKYPQDLFQTGSYQEARKLCRETWNDDEYYGII